MLHCEAGDTGAGAAQQKELVQAEQATEKAQEVFKPRRSPGQRTRLRSPTDIGRRFCRCGSLDIIGHAT